MATEFKYGDLVLKLETNQPSESVQKKASLELRETPQNIANGLKELKMLLEAEHNLITPITNDEWLLMILRRCKFYPESARDFPLLQEGNISIKLVSQKTDFKFSICSKPKGKLKCFSFQRKNRKLFTQYEQGYDNLFCIVTSEIKILLYDPIAAKTRYLKLYYNIRNKYPEITRMLAPSKLKHVFDSNLVSISPKRDQHGRRIIVILSGKQWDYNLFPIADILSSGVLCTDILYKEPETQINGVVYILDLAGFSFGHIPHFSPYHLKRTLDFIQDEPPLRVKGFHIVNQPKIFQPLFAAIKTFFSAKFSKRILMHGTNYESLHRHIAPECLPKCYGGTLKSELMYSKETYQLLSQYENLFEEFQKYRLTT